jgi:hypothetical protein
MLMFEEKVLRTIFGTKGGHRRLPELHKEQLHDLYCSLNSIRVRSGPYYSFGTIGCLPRT